MKRSEINTIIRDAMAFIGQFSFALPPFAGWTPEDWARKGRECDEIRDNMLGWDITDYGLGRFSEVGLVLVTIRNGNYGDPRYEKPYAEKLLISRENQVCPMHFHRRKMEDIINRGGGTLMMQLYNSAEDGTLDTTGEVHVVSDGVALRVPAGTVLELQPGQSVTLTHGLYHAFWAKPGLGPVLIGEVSQCNDDLTDNFFLEKMGRFPAIEEDEAPFRYLCFEYPKAD
jgi:D-lyxose ketol-isomerase